MAVLIVLLVTFAIAVLAKQIWLKPITYCRCGQLAIATMFIFAGISHFVLADGIVWHLRPLEYLTIAGLDRRPK